MKLKINIAIDGYSSCGKSTLAKSISREFGMSYFDSGAMYRAITLFCIENKIIQKSNIDLNKLHAFLKDLNIAFRYNIDLDISETFLNNRNVENLIRTYNISSYVSVVSEIGIVRDKLLILQQEIGKKRGVVMDGRDIGTKVLPDAELKFFLKARSKVRAKRRFKEMEASNSKISFVNVLDSLLKRDKRDINREINPLRVAKDAIVIDNSELSIQQQNDYVFNIIKKYVDENSN